jgi:SanA protein
LLAGGLAILLCDKRVQTAAVGKTYNEAAKTPFNRVGLLLGTSKYLAGGRENQYYNYRIVAALELLQACRIDYLVISGDNSRPEYNEPGMMRADLMAAGIDSNRLYLDYAGFRTFDSIIRLREIFSQHAVTVISQKFHNERALYIAQREGIKAIAYNAKDVSKAAGFKTQLREKGARVKVFLDYLLGAEPHFLGEKIAIKG